MNSTTKSDDPAAPRAGSSGEAEGAIGSVARHDFDPGQGELSRENLESDSADDAPVGVGARGPSPADPRPTGWANKPRRSPLDRTSEDLVNVLRERGKSELASAPICEYDHN
jgi:hypothetical protein